MALHRPMLLAPLRYWEIRHPVKRSWDVVFPTFGAAVLTAALLLWPSVPSAYGAGGFLSSLQNLFAIMGGFFVSALTLVSTSAASSLHLPIAASPKLHLQGEAGDMTRQRFLSLLFGYLAFSAFALYAIGFFAMLAAPGARMIFPVSTHVWISAVFLFGYSFWLSHVFTTTLVGLYYFTDRLQRNDPQVIRTPVDIPAE